jgi:hypothetical protein
MNFVANQHNLFIPIDVLADRYRSAFVSQQINTFTHVDTIDIICFS